MYKLKLPLPKTDKLLHFFYGSIIAFPSVLLFGIYGLMFTFIISLTKEVIYDKLLKKGTFEVADIVFSTVPAVLFLIIKIL